MARDHRVDGVQLPRQRLAGVRKAAPANMVRRIRRRFHRSGPAVLLALLLVLIAAATTLDSLPWTRDGVEKFGESHVIVVGLGLNIVVALAATALAYYALWGKKQQRALGLYRDIAMKTPGKLVDWSEGEVDLVRKSLCRVLAGEIANSAATPIVIVRARPGTGGATMLTRLVQELAGRNLIPVPVLLSRETGFEPFASARSKFCDEIDRVLSSEGEADAIWRRATKTSSLVLLLDGVTTSSRRAAASSPNASATCSTAARETYRLRDDRDASARARFDHGTR